MNKAKGLVILNPLLFISALIQATTGVMLFFSLFPAQIESIAQVHNYNGLLFICLVISHLALNWNWVKSNFFKKPVKTG